MQLRLTCKRTFKPHSQIVFCSVAFVGKKDCSPYAGGGKLSRTSTDTLFDHAHQLIDLLFDLLYTRLVLNPANQLLIWLNGLLTDQRFEIRV